MYKNLRPRFSLLHLQSGFDPWGKYGEQYGNFFSCKALTLQSSWIWMIPRWGISQITFPVFFWMGFLWLGTSDWLRMNLTTEAIGEDCPLFSDPPNSPFQQLPSPINSKSKCFHLLGQPEFTVINKTVQETLLFHASAFSSHHSHLCSFPSSHSSLYTLLWMHFYFCSLLGRLCPDILAWFFSSLLSDLCSNTLFSERSSPKSHWNSSLCALVTL